MKRRRLRKKRGENLFFYRGKSRNRGVRRGVEIEVETGVPDAYNSGALKIILYSLKASPFLLL